VKYLLEIYIIVVVLFLIVRFNKNRRVKKLRKAVSQNWGKAKIDEYFNFDLIGKYFYNSTRDKSNFHQVISDETCNDLDIHTLFKYIDRTSSKIGQQYFYFKLRALQLNIDELKRFDMLIDSFGADASLRLACQMELLKISSTNAYYIEELINENQIKKPKWLPFVYLLTLGAIVCICLGPIIPGIILLLLPIYITNLVIYYWNKRNINYSLVSVSEFLRSIKIMKKISSQPSIKNHFGDLSFINKLSKVTKKTQFINFEKRVDGDITAIVSFLADLIKIMFNIEVLTYFSFIESLKRERENINRLFITIGEIDSAISVASVRKEHEIFCRPAFVTGKKVRYQAIFHPLITNCISNDLILDDQSMLLTGSNMSGKTTFIRTVAINAIMAQAFYTCFAKEYTAPFFRLYSSIRISDALSEGKSYYLQEVLVIKELIDQSEKAGQCLFILDEIFKGTNTVERISGGKAILSYLNKKDHMVFVSTHDIELTELLTKQNYCLYHFEEHVENDKLIFDYKLKNGALKTRNAIKILELYKYPGEIITDANEQLAGFLNLN
jgi:hypothetical protein